MQGLKDMHMLLREQRKSWERFYSHHGDPWRVYKDYSLEKYLEKNSLILDICSGTGKASYTLSEKGYKVILLDFSMNSLRRTSGKEYGKVLGNALKMPFREDSFDVLIASHALSHMLLNEREIALNEIIRVAKDGAILVFESFSTDDFRYGKGMEIEKSTYLRGNGIITHYFTEGELESMFKGFEILDRKVKIVNRKIFRSIYKMVALVFIVKINKNKKVFIPVNN